MEMMRNQGRRTSWDDEALPLEPKVSLLRQPSAQKETPRPLPLPLLLVLAREGGNTNHPEQA